MTMTQRQFGIPVSPPRLPITARKRRFVLTEDLVKLLRASCVSDRLSDVECGGAEIDPKRPYGNGSPERDIARILGWPCGEELSDEDEIRAGALHRQTPTALQIVLSSGSFEPGTFEMSLYGSRWERVIEP